MSQLHVLVAVPYDDEGRKISGFLDRRSCRCELQTDGDHALRATRDAKGLNDPFDLVLADYRLPNLDGLSLIGEIHRMDPGAVCCLMAEGHRLSEATHGEARRLGCRHALAKPLDYGKLQRIVERLHRQKAAGETLGTGSYSPHSGHATQSEEQTPFFGTKRLAPGTGQIGSGPHGAKHTPPGGSDLPLDPFEEQLEHGPPATRDSTSRRRRAVPGSAGHQRPDHRRQPMSGAFDEPPTNASPTRRIRRGVTGRVERKPEEEQEEVKAHTARLTRSAIQVACTHCGERFSVVRKAERYTMPCLHCGGVNTIEPR